MHAAPRSRSRRPRTSSSPPPRSTSGRSPPRSRSASPRAAPALIAALAARAAGRNGAPGARDGGRTAAAQAPRGARGEPAPARAHRGSQSRRLPYLLDDEALTLGAGAGGHSWPLAELPDPAAVDWPALRRRSRRRSSPAPTARPRSCACSPPVPSAAGRTTGYCCTDGVFVAGQALGTGDYSGPAGARRVLRDARVEAADPRDRARRHPAARARGRARGRRRHHQHRRRPFRRVRRARPRGAGRGQACGRARPRRRGASWS